MACQVTESSCSQGLILFMGFSVAMETKMRGKVETRLTECKATRTWGLQVGFYCRNSKLPEEEAGNQEECGRYLQVLNAELVSIHVDSGQEDGLHLVVTQLVGRQMGSNENLVNSKHKACQRKELCCTIGRRL